jgi:hypothetical protein
MGEGAGAGAGAGTGTGAGTGAGATTEKVKTEVAVPAALVARTVNVCDPRGDGHGRKSEPLLPCIAYGAAPSVLV